MLVPFLGWTFSAVLNDSPAHGAGVLCGSSPWGLDRRVTPQKSTDVGVPAMARAELSRALGEFRAAGGQETGGVMGQPPARLRALTIWAQQDGRDPICGVS